jgi:hypothetical protein
LYDESRGLVVFKSVPDSWAREARDVKCTVRLVDNLDPRFQALRAGSATWIRIDNTDTGEGFVGKIAYYQEFDAYLLGVTTEPGKVMAKIGWE